MGIHRLFLQHPFRVIHIYYKTIFRLFLFIYFLSNHFFFHFLGQRKKSSGYIVHRPHIQVKCLLNALVFGTCKITRDGLHILVHPNETWMFPINKITIKVPKCSKYLIKACNLFRFWFQCFNFSFHYMCCQARLRL